MGSAKRLTYWQRRYLLKHYRRFDDATLARGACLGVAKVQGYLSQQRALRSPGDLRRMEKAGAVEPPEMFTPEQARERITTIESRSLGRADAWPLLAMLLGSLVLYGATAARTVTGEDAGELLAAAHGFGVPHPPGYPLWLVLSWAADHLLPFGTVAWRVSLASVVPAALANTLLLAIALKTMRSLLAAVVGSALFAVSLTHWTQAVIPEVYGLNTFFVALSALLLLRLAERPSASRLLALAFATGLSATNHTTAVPVAALAVVGAVLVAPLLFVRPRVLAGALLAGIAPLALYLVLPLASAQQPYVDWGNPETGDALWRHVTRQQYAEVEVEQQAAGGHASYVRRLSILGQAAGQQFGSPWVLVLAAVGFVALFVRQTGLWLFFTAVGWVCSVGVTRYTAFSFDREHLYANQIFWIPAWLVLAWMVAGGIDVLLLALRRHPGRVSWLASGLATVGLVAVVAVPGIQHVNLADRSQTTAVADYGRSVLDVMEPGALYFPSSDHSTFAVLYFQGVEDLRPDVVLADKYGQIERDVIEPLITEEDQDILLSLSGKDRRRYEESILIRRWDGPVYFANRREMSDLPGYELEPVGLLFKVMTPEEATAWWAEPTPGEDPLGLALWEDHEHLLDVDEHQLVDFTVQMVRGDAAYLKGFAQLRAGRLDAAIATWETIEADLAPLKQLYNNMGSALAENGRLAEALDFYQRALDEDGQYVTALRNLAMVQINTGQTGAAIRTLQQLVEAEPEHREARLERARLLASAERHLEALAEYEALARIDRKDPLPWREAGQLLEQGGDLDKAQDAYAESLRLDPSQVHVRQRLERLKMGIPLLAEESGDPGGRLPGEHVQPFQWGEAAGAPTAQWMPTTPTPGPKFDPMRNLPPRP